MSADHLPDPAWADWDAVCTVCGYSLAGLTPPTRCPECGAPHSGRQFVIYGIADARSTMSTRRKVAVALILVFFGLLSQLFGIALIFLPWWTVPAALAVGGGLAAWLVISSPQSQGGSARIVMDPSGVAVAPLKFKHRKPGTAAAVTIFTGTERLELKPVSDVWANLRIRNAQGRSLFSAGIRCPSHQYEEVVTAVGDMITKTGPTAGLAPPPLPS